MAHLINKARRPKFEVHLKIYDLNNVPLVQGYSHVKWHLPHSIHGEHRGRTPKSPIANHRVEYNYGKLVPVRIAIDKANSLAECPIEFEVIQEFPSSASFAAGSRDEKITLGRLTLNLAEYVEESEAVMRDTGYRARGPSISSGSLAGANTGGGAGSGGAQAHARKRSSLSAHTPITPSDSTSSPKSIPNSPPPNADAHDTSNNKAPSINDPAAAPSAPEAQVEEGIIRRYLMSDSKINSTIKIGILMVQLDGERNFIAPALKIAATFGGIAGMTSSSSGGNSASSHHPAAEEFGQHFHDTIPGGGGLSSSARDPTDPGAQYPSSATTTTTTGGGGASSSSSSRRDVHELQDMYRRALAASWACQPGELPADECIEDIFQGGDGFSPDGGGALENEKNGHGPGDMTPRAHGHGHGSHARGGGGGRRVMRRQDSGSSSTGEANEFLKPGYHSPKRAGAAGQQRRHHARHGSGESTNTLRHDSGGGGGGGWQGNVGGLGIQGNGAPQQQQHRGRPGHRRDSSRDSGSLQGGMVGLRNRSDSLASLAGTIESERGRSGFKNARELTEWEVRDDLVAWKLPETAS